MSEVSEKVRALCRKFCSAVVLAAGGSMRMGEDKLLMRLDDVPVIAMTLKALNGCSCIDEIVVVTHRDKIEQIAGLCGEYGATKVKKVVCGGGTRTESALAGVSETDKRAQIILIHDGARPFITGDIAENVVRAAASYNSAAPAIPENDTVRLAENGEAYETPDRSHVFRVQTPQAFHADLIKAALTMAVQQNRSCTDDCAAMEAMGIKTHLVAGSAENIKLTTPDDLVAAEMICRKRRGD